MLNPGDRIELVNMPDDPAPLAPGSRGTVRSVRGPFSGSLQVDVEWDNGRSIMLAMPPDTVRRVNPEPIEREEVK